MKNLIMYCYSIVCCLFAIGIKGPSGVRFITRNELYTIMQQSEDCCLDKKIDYMKNILLNRENYSEQQKQMITDVVKGFKKRIKEKWAAARRKQDVFLKQNKEWLQGSVELPIVGSHLGRPQKPFSELSLRSKRRKTIEARKTFSTDKIKFITQMKLHERGQRNAAKVLDDITSSPTRATKYLEAYYTSTPREVEQLSPVEALSMFVEAECMQLVINSVNVPPTVKAIDTDYIILDCDYDLQNTSSIGLVVKWFFDNNKVAYQWIYGRKPLAEEPVKKYIDLEYKASDNPLTQYRAMKLNNPGVDLTGVYTCVISTFADERTENASMIVYSTAKKFDLIYRKKSIEDMDGVEVTCLAEGLYPEPTLNISVEGAPDVQAVKPTVTLRADGLYDILSRITLLDDDIPKATVLKCLLSIPKANYNISRKSVYYSGISTTTSGATTKLLGKMEIENSDSQPGNGGGCSAVQVPIGLLFLAAEAFLLSMTHL